MFHFGPPCCFWFTLGFHLSPCREKARRANRSLCKGWEAMTSPSSNAMLAHGPGDLPYPPADLRGQESGSTAGIQHSQENIHEGKSDKQNSRRRGQPGHRSPLFPSRKPLRRGYLEKNMK
jgi:hypothetical protein